MGIKFINDTRTPYYCLRSTHERLLVICFITISSTHGKHRLQTSHTFSILVQCDIIAHSIFSLGLGASVATSKHIAT